MTTMCDVYPIVSRYMSNFPSNADVIFKNGMYPLRIECCNAMTNACFSKAFISWKCEEGFPMLNFTDLNKLAYFLRSTRSETVTHQTDDFDRAVKRLEKFLSESE